MRTYVPILIAASAFGFAMWPESLAESVSPKNDELVAVKMEPPEDVATELIIELPEDGDTWHTSLFTHRELRFSNRQKDLVSWFSSHPQLKLLKGQTMFHTYSNSHPIYTSRFTQAVNDFPAVVLQKGDGRIIYKATGSSVPGNADELASQIATQLAKYRRDCPGGVCRPRSQPVEPEIVLPEMPEQKPERKPLRERIPDIGVPVKVGFDKRWIAVAALAFAVAFTFRRSRS